MGQEIRGVSEDPPLTGSAGADTGDADSLGRYLARQRKLRGISLTELASQTRIPRRSLERLEDGAFDHQDDGFARGFVRTVAAALGLDAEEAVMRLLDEPAPEPHERALHLFALRRWAVATSLLLAGIAVVFGVWSLWSSDSQGPNAALSDEVVFRRDAVRELAKAERESGDKVEGLESGREGHPD